MRNERLDYIRNLTNKATKGPWRVWDGPSYVGGGKDLCVGAGEEWLVNMDHRRCEYKRYLEMKAMGFGSDEFPRIRECDPPDQCDVCSIVDDDEITAEQQANADFIAEARTLVPELLAEIDRLRSVLSSKLQGF